MLTRRAAILRYMTKRRRLTYKDVEAVTGLAHAMLIKWQKHQIPTPPGLLDKLDKLLDLSTEQLDHMTTDQEPPRRHKVPGRKPMWPTILDMDARLKAIEETLKHGR